MARVGRDLAPRLDDAAGGVARTRGDRAVEALSVDRFAHSCHSACTREAIDRERRWSHDEPEEGHEEARGACREDTWVASRRAAELLDVLLPGRRDDREPAQGAQLTANSSEQARTSSTGWVLWLNSTSSLGSGSRQAPVRSSATSTCSSASDSSSRRSRVTWGQPPR